MIKSKYPIRKFSDVFDSVSRSFVLDDLTDYRCMGIRLYGLGAFVREEKPGMTIKRKKQWLVHTGDIVYNKLFAWKGTFCIADSKVNGCIASDKFPTFIARDNIDLDYLRFWFRTKELALEAKLLSRGAAALSKLTLNPPDFWKLPIPLPSLYEQQRVARSLKVLLARVEAVEGARAPIDAVLQGRRAGIGSELRLMMTAALGEFSRALSGGLGVLGDVLTMRPRSGPSFPCSEESQGIKVIMPSALGGFRLDKSKVLFGDENEKISVKDALTRGDILISRGNKRDQVGLCVVYDSDDPCTYANLLMRMQVDANRTSPWFVKYWLMAPIAIEHVRKNTKGTSPSVQKINQKGLMSIPFPSDIPLPKQEAWVTYLSRIFTRVDHLEELARGQHGDAIATRESVLSAAFRGKL